MLQWRVKVLEELKAAGWYPRKIRMERLFGESTVQKMRSQKLLSWAEFDRLCKVLGKQPGDLLEWVPDEEAPEEEPAADATGWYQPSEEGANEKG